MKEIALDVTINNLFNEQLRNQCMGILGNGRRRTLQRRRLFHPGGNKRNGTGNIQILNDGTITGIFRSTDRSALSLSGDKAASCHVGCRLPDFPCLCFCLFLFKDICGYGTEHLLCSHQHIRFLAMDTQQGRQEQTAEDIETAPQEVILYRNMTLRLFAGISFSIVALFALLYYVLHYSPIRRYRQLMLYHRRSESSPPGCCTPDRRALDLLDRRQLRIRLSLLPAWALSHNVSLYLLRHTGGSRIIHLEKERNKNK